MIQIKQHQMYTSHVIEISQSTGFITIDEAFLTKFEALINNIHTITPKAVVFLFKANPDKKQRPISIAGGNLKELNQYLENPVGAALFFARARKILNQILDLKPLVIVASEGSCIGGGAEWFLHSDYSFLSQGAYLHFKQLEVGLPFGFGGEQQIQHRCGAVLTNQLIFNTQKIEANSAKEINLIHETLKDDANSELILFLKKLEKYPTQAIYSQKQNLKRPSPDIDSVTKTFMQAWGNETYRKTLKKFNA